ncbi:MAG: hypothetical protein SV186_03025 [Candidatus Nanohaloarchaea archaeon]|nr:hypothetical protein [Candidatus Nanohaloarchaea archaeon]
MVTLNKGQSQVVTAVLLGGILIVGISSAYTWGVPLLQKNKDVNKLQNTVSTFKKLEQEIESVAQRGGTGQIRFKVGSGFLRVSAENNTIIYTVTTNAAYVATGEWVPLNENDLAGIAVAGRGEGYGIRNQDKPGVLIANADYQGDNYQTTFKLVFRELQSLSSNKGYIIDLVGSGNLEASGGTHQIIVQQGDEVIEQGASATNGPLQKQRIKIRIN